MSCNGVTPKLHDICDKIPFVFCMNIISKNNYNTDFIRIIYLTKIGFKFNFQAFIIKIHISFPQNIRIATNYISYTFRPISAVICIDDLIGFRGRDCVGRLVIYK